MIFQLGEVNITVFRKDIKNIHLSVYPPHGVVKMTAPNYMGEETLRLYAISKLAWIKREQKKFRDQARESARQFIQQESVYLWGNRYLLNIISNQARPYIEFDEFNINFYSPKYYTKEQRTLYFSRWYRKKLREFSEPLICSWSEKLHVHPNKLLISRMKTKWGSCNSIDRNIRLNTELAKKPKPCVEYILVHELLHLIGANHSEHFVSLMDQYLPDWRIRRDLLNELPIHFNS